MGARFAGTYLSTLSEEEPTVIAQCSFETSEGFTALASTWTQGFGPVTHADDSAVWSG